jgi:hypothetical protein
VPLEPYRDAGSRVASVAVEVNGAVTFVNGLVVSAKLVGFHAGTCPTRAHRPAV